MYCPEFVRAAPIFQPMSPNMACYNVVNVPDYVNKLCVILQTCTKMWCTALLLGIALSGALFIYIVVGCHPRQCIKIACEWAAAETMHQIVPRGFEKCRVVSLCLCLFSLFLSFSAASCNDSHPTSTETCPDKGSHLGRKQFGRRVSLDVLENTVMSDRRSNSQSREK